LKCYRWRVIAGGYVSPTGRDTHDKLMICRTMTDMLKCGRD